MRFLTLSILLIVISSVCNLSYSQSLKEIYLNEKDETSGVVKFYDYYDSLIGVDKSFAEKELAILIDNLKKKRYKFTDIVKDVFYGVDLIENDKYQEAIELYKNSLNRLSDKSLDSKASKTLYFRICLLISQCYGELDNEKEALDYLYTALEKAKDVEDAEGLSLLYNSLALSMAEYSELSEYIQQYLDKASSYKNSVKNPETKMLLQLNYVMKSMREGDFEHADSILNDLYHNVKKSSEPEAFMAYYMLKVMVHLTENSLDKAQAYRDSMYMVKDFEPSANDSITLFFIDGVLYKEKKEYDLAKINLKKSIDLAVRFNSYNDILSASELLYETARIENNSEDALMYSDMFMSYMDSVSSDLPVKYAAMDNKFNIRQATKQRKLIEEVSSKKSMIIYLISALMIIVFAGGVVMYRQFRELQFSHKKLVDKNRELVQLSQRKSELTSENKLTDIDKVDDTTNGDINTGKDILYGKIVSKLEREKIFLNTELKLSNLAKDVDSNTSYVSETINKHFNKSFSVLINEYRVKEALKLLENDMTKQFTIEHIGQKSGFKSRTSFYTAFKQFTGVSPSYYIKNKGIA